VGSTPEEFRAYIKAQIPMYTDIIKAAGVKIE
jgi:tripartite-type tricarboxylate transporter receptor subunit TctC